MLNLTHKELSKFVADDILKLILFFREFYMNHPLSTRFNEISNFIFSAK